jgi:hypothetical protein
MRAAGLGMGPTVDTYRHTTSGKEVTRANSRAVARIYKCKENRKAQRNPRADLVSRMDLDAGSAVR